MSAGSFVLHPSDVMTVDLPAVSRLAHLRNAIWRQRAAFVMRITVEAAASVPVTLTFETATAAQRASLSDHA